MTAKAGIATRLPRCRTDADGLVENMRRLDLSPGDIEIIVLSHGHWDHVTGMDGLVRRLGAVEHARADPSRVLDPPPTGIPRLRPDRAAHDEQSGAGGADSRSSNASALLPCSTERSWSLARSIAPRRSSGLPGHQRHRHERREPDPLILDDQALVANVRGHGLVVLTGCGHSGVINILRYVRTLTGEDRLHALLGGFHLSGKAFEPIIGPTCDALEEFSPDFLVPAYIAAGGGPPTRSPRAFPMRSSRPASARVSSSPRPRPKVR